MAITREAVLHVARLARLELESDEVTRMQRDLDNILGHVAQLEKLPTDGVPETAHVANERSPMREDALLPSLDSDAALGEAPRRTGTAFAVPGFVDE